MSHAERVLVTGASGQLGRRLVANLADAGIAYRPSLHHPSQQSGGNALVWDITEQPPAELRSWQPTLILHAAAMTDVDGCEIDPRSAWLTNMHGTQNVCSLARECGARVVFISTDSVFDGQRGWYRDDEETGPVNVYSRTKREAEKVVIADPAAVVVRMNIVSPERLTAWILETARTQGVVRAYSDVIFNPLPVEQAAWDLITIGLSDLAGTVHVGTETPLSKADYAERLLAAAGLSEQTTVVRIFVDEAALPAVRPKNCSLSPSDSARVLLGPRSLDAAILQYVRNAGSLSAGVGNHGRTGSDE